MTTDSLTLHYDSVAPEWDRKIKRLGYHTAYEHLVERVDHTGQNVRALDAGCGSGAFAAALSKRLKFTTVDLLDSAPAMLADARQRLSAMGVTVGQDHSSLFDDAVPSGSYDVVLAGHVIEHTANPAETLAWLASRMKPDGTLLLSVSRPHWCTALIRIIWRHKAYRPDTVLDWGRSAGLTGEAVAFPKGPPSRTSMGYVFRRPK